MKIVFLGTGTSVGIPVIGCHCPVCRSSDPRNKRRRSSLLVESGGVDIVIDTSLDFRDQALTFGIPRVDAVLVTHSHADHIFGMDDIRRYNTLQHAAIPVYASPETVADLRRIFSYIRADNPEAGVFRPMLHFNEIQGRVEIGPFVVEPLPVVHGRSTTYGYRLESAGRTVGYVPDCKEMSDETVRRLAGVDVMVLDGLRHRPHPTHVTVAESTELLRRIGAKRSYLTHMCHELDHEETQESLPLGVFVSCDGMTIEW